MRGNAAVVAVAIAYSVIIGCGGIRTNVIELPAPAFDPTLLGSYAAGSGGSSITGSGFARQRGGGVVSCAGNTVYLMPDTAFYSWVITPVVEERIDGTLGFDSRMGASESYPVADRLAGEPLQYVRAASCDIDGRFEFAEVPRGAYLVATVITWFVSGSGQQGGPVFERVSVDGDQSTDVTLTNVN